MMKKSPPQQLQSISAMHQFMKIKKPTHPLVSVINLSNVDDNSCQDDLLLSYHFYSMSVKKNFEGKLRYGQQYYDFNEGVMTFLAPHQICGIQANTSTKMDGYMLIVHPDFFSGHPLAAKIRDYGFFSYAANEALHLSEQEEAVIVNIMENISREIASSIDAFTQNVIISHVDLLLNYADRFYHRQFLTRKSVHHDLLMKLETLLSDYFNSGQLATSGLPTVQSVAAQLNLSPNYLSDMLRAHTGQNTKQHIQNHLIDKAKEILSTTSLSVSEIAYQLGFEYPQSFNKLFKSKTNLSPLEFRHSFN